MAAKKKEIRAVARADALAADLVATQQTTKLYVPEKTKQTEFLEGTPKQAAAKLVEKLRHEARVL